MQDVARTLRPSKFVKDGLRQSGEEEKFNLGKPTKLECKSWTDGLTLQRSTGDCFRPKLTPVITVQASASHFREGKSALNGSVRVGGADTLTAVGHGGLVYGTLGQQYLSGSFIYNGSGSGAVSCEVEQTARSFFLFQHVLRCAKLQLNSTQKHSWAQASTSFAKKAWEVTTGVLSNGDRHHYCTVRIGHLDPLQRGQCTQHQRSKPGVGQLLEQQRPAGKPRLFGSPQQDKERGCQWALNACIPLLYGSPGVRTSLRNIADPWKVHAAFSDGMPWQKERRWLLKCSRDLGGRINIEVRAERHKAMPLKLEVSLGGKHPRFGAVSSKINATRAKGVEMSVMVGKANEETRASHLAAVARGPAANFHPSNKLHARATLAMRRRSRHMRLRLEGYFPM